MKPTAAVSVLFLMISTLVTMPILAKADRSVSTVPIIAPNDGRPKMIWMDRGTLTPSQIFFGPASESPNPVSELPAPPYKNFKPNDKPNKFTPKAYITDANGVKWTAKFTAQSHSDVAAPRIAWALGFGVDETYYVGGGEVHGMWAHESRGKATPFVSPTGQFQEARLKRHPEHHVKDGNGNDIFWDEAINPGVPQQQLDGLKVLDVMLMNWDAQPKNCEIVKSEDGGQKADWYVMSDWGKTFGKMGSIWNLKEYQSAPFILNANSSDVSFYYQARIPGEAAAHRQIPTADVLWFRSQVDKLTDDDIRAAFNAGVATPELTAAYASGDITRADALTSPEVNGYVAAFRRRIEELDKLAPPSGT